MFTRLFKDDFPLSPRKWPFFYGYFIVLCTALGLIVSVPGQTIGVSVFTDYLIRNLDVTRFQLSNAYMIGTIGSSLIIGRTGRLLDTAGVRFILFLTALCFGLVLVVMGQVDRVADAVNALTGDFAPRTVSLVIVTVGFLCMRYLGQGVMALGVRIMLMKWFSDLRGRMNSIVGIAVSFAFAGSPVLFETLIRRFDWRGAWLVLGCAIGGGASLFIWAFFRDTPEASGLLPDGRRDRTEEKGESSGGKAERGYTLAEAQRTVTFWVFNLSCSMFSLFATAFTFHVVSIFREAGHSRVDALSIFLPGSVIAVAAGLLSGWLSDREPFKSRLKYLLMIQQAGMILLGAGLLVLQQGCGRYLVIIGNGLATGLFGNMVAISWPRLFGRAHLGAISGRNMSFLVFFSAVGPPIFGWAFSRLDSYAPAVALCTVINMLILIAAFRAHNPQLKGLQ